MHIPTTSSSSPCMRGNRSGGGNMSARTCGPSAVYDVYDVAEACGGQREKRNCRCTANSSAVQDDFLRIIAFGVKCHMPTSSKRPSLPPHCQIRSRPIRDTPHHIVILQGRRRRLCSAEHRCFLEALSSLATGTTAAGEIGRPR